MHVIVIAQAVLGHLLRHPQKAAAVQTATIQTVVLRRVMEVLLIQILTKKKESQVTEEVEKYHPSNVFQTNSRWIPSCYNRRYVQFSV